MPTFTRFRRALTMPTRPSDSSSQSSSPSSSTTTTASNSSTDLPGTPISASPNSTPYTSKRNSVADLPTVVLTKTTSGLSRFRSGLTRDPEEKYRRKLEDWKKKDEAEWARPSARTKGRRSTTKLCKQSQDLLRGFEFNCDPRSSLDGGKTDSIMYGISPCTTRNATVAHCEYIEATS